MVDFQPLFVIGDDSEMQGFFTISWLADENAWGDGIDIYYTLSGLYTGTIIDEGYVFQEYYNSNDPWAEDGSRYGSLDYIPFSQHGNFALCQFGKNMLSLWQQEVIDVIGNGSGTDIADGTMIPFKLDLDLYVIDTSIWSPDNRTNGRSDARRATVDITIPWKFEEGGFF